MATKSGIELQIEIILIRGRVNMLHIGKKKTITDTQPISDKKLRIMKKVRH